MSTHSGTVSITAMKSLSSAGASGTASMPSLQAVLSIRIRPGTPYVSTNDAYGSATTSPSIVAVRISSTSRSSAR